MGIFQKILYIYTFEYKFDPQPPSPSLLGHCPKFERMIFC